MFKTQPPEQILVNITCIFFLIEEFYYMEKNSQKRDNIKKKDNKTTKNLMYVHK